MTKEELIKELLDELNIKEQLVLGGLDYLYTIREVDDELQKLLNEKVNKNMEILVSELINFYDKKFTINEIQNILNFIRGKPGEKFLNMVTGKDKEVTEIASNWFKEIMEEAIREREQNILKEQVKRGISWRDYVPPLDIKLY